MGAEVPAIMTREFWGEGNRYCEIHAGKWVSARMLGRNTVGLRLKAWAGFGGTGIGRILLAHRQHGRKHWEVGQSSSVRLQVKERALPALLLVYLWGGILMISLVGPEEFVQEKIFKVC